MNEEKDVHRRSTGRRRTYVIVAFSIFVLIWAALFLASGSLQRGPSPKHMGGDYALLLSGAEVLQAGGNPYDQRVLYLAEKKLSHRAGVSAPPFDPYMRVGNPSILFWAMERLTHFSFQTSAKIWTLGMYLLLGVGFLACLIRMGWRRRWLPLILFMALPQTIYAAFYGNVDAIIFASLAWSAALTRTRPFIGGALLSLALLKPQVGLPGALLVILFLTPCRLRACAGFLAAIVFALAITLLTTGLDSLGWWLHALVGYSQRLSVQPDIASLSGLYVYSASDWLRVTLEAVSLLGVAGATAAWWWMRPPVWKADVLNIAWLWLAWFLATPFAHFHDEVVLALPVLALVGPDARWLGGWPAALALFALLFSILVFPTNRTHTDLQSLTLVVAFGCAIAQMNRGAAYYEPDDSSVAIASPSGLRA